MIPYREDGCEDHDEGDDDEANISYDEFESVNDEVCEESLGMASSRQNACGPSSNIGMSPKINFKTFDN